MAVVVGTNSYVSIADATIYFNESLSYGSTWVGLDPLTQEQILVTAARMLDRQTWAGQKTSPTQAMQWPRANVTDKYGNLVDSTTVPQDIINAQCELGMAIYNDPTVQTNKDTTFNLKSVKGGPAEVQYFRPINGGRFPTIIQELVAQYMGGSASLMAPFVSGNDGESKFDPCDPENNYGVVRGFS